MQQHLQCCVLLVDFLCQGYFPLILDIDLLNFKFIGIVGLPQPITIVLSGCCDANSSLLVKFIGAIEGIWESVLFVEDEGALLLEDKTIKVELFVKTRCRFFKLKELVLSKKSPIKLIFLSFVVHNIVLI